MAADRNTQAREYLRVSHDRFRERSNDEQHNDNSRSVTERGWTLGDPYRDTGSASRYATRSRDGYDLLVSDLGRDRFDADVLVLWESSRGNRKVGEWVTLIELCEERSVRIHVTTHNRTYDPANARDHRSLLEDAVDSEYESAKISERARRAALADAADGKPHGPVPYGYRRLSFRARQSGWPQRGGSVDAAVDRAALAGERTRRSAGRAGRTDDRCPRSVR